MKFGCIFAMSSPKTSTDRLTSHGAFLCPEIGGISSQIYGLLLSYWTPVRSLYGAVFGETEGSSLSCYNIHSNSFPTMPKTETICAGAKHSNAARVSNPDTVQSTATIRMRCSNPYSIPVFEDFMAECQRRFDTEREAKNKAYYFIMSKGLSEDFREFCKEHDSRDSHKDCVDYLLSKIK